jgi:hypothetical protein
MGDHLIVMHSAVRNCPGYSRHEAPSMEMDGASIARDTEHGKTVSAQLTRRQETLADAIDAGVFALGAAGLGKGIRRQARTFCEDYFHNRLKLPPGFEVNQPAPDEPGLGPLPEEMYLALEAVIELIVDGEYEELHDLSDGALEIDDLRRRLEEDVPEPLVLPPREHYRVEAIAKSDDSGQPGWAYFLDLWTETGPSRLHIEGDLEPSGDRFRTTLIDIAP